MVKGKEGMNEWMNEMRWIIYIVDVLRGMDLPSFLSFSTLIDWEVNEWVVKETLIFDFDLIGAVSAGFYSAIDSPIVSLALTTYRHTYIYVPTLIWLQKECMHLELRADYPADSKHEDKT